MQLAWEQCRWPSWRSKKLPTPGGFWKFPAGPGYRSTSGRWSPLGQFSTRVTYYYIMYFMWSDLEGTFFWGNPCLLGICKVCFPVMFLPSNLIDQSDDVISWAGAELNHLLGRCLCAPGLSWAQLGSWRGKGLFWPSPLKILMAWLDLRRPVGAFTGSAINNGNGEMGSLLIVIMDHSLIPC